MSVQQGEFHGFANLADPSPTELKHWAYHPDSVALRTMPPDWDLIVASDRLIGAIVEIAFDRECPARRFALHCLHIYAADAIRTNFRAHPRRRLRKLVGQAENDGDEPLKHWAHNTRMLLARPELFDYHEWCEGGLVRNPRRLG